MRPADLPAVSAISDSTHGRYSEPRDIYAERLTLYPAGCLMFQQQGQAPSGYLLSHPWQGEMPPKLHALLSALPEAADHHYLHDIALLPSARGSGAGKAALASVVNHAREIGLAEVRLIAVNGADSFWATQGFAYVEDTDERALQSYGSGAYLMRYGIET